jgi:hypothetical protein
MGAEGGGIMKVTYTPNVKTREVKNEFMGTH